MNYHLDEESPAGFASGEEAGGGSNKELRAGSHCRDVEALLEFRKEKGVEDAKGLEVKRPVKRRRFMKSGESDSWLAIIVQFQWRYQALQEELVCFSAFSAFLAPLAPPLQLFLKALKKIIDT